MLGYDVAVDPSGDLMVLRYPGESRPRIGIQFGPEKVVKGRIDLDLTLIVGELEVEIWRPECPGDGGCAPSKTTLTNHTGSCPDRKATSSATHDRHGNPDRHGGRVHLPLKTMAIR